MMRSAKLCLLAAAIGLVFAAGISAAASAASRHQLFHVSAYGIQRQNIVETYVAAPCKLGGQGGGYDGVLTVNSRITWETIRPGKALFVGFRNDGFLTVLSDRNGLQTRVKISRKVTNNVQFIHCSVEGLPLPSPDPRHIGTDCPTTDSRGFLFDYKWLKGKLHTIFFPEPAENSSLNQDYQGCYGNKAVNGGIHVEVPAPAPDLGNPRLGKIITTQRFSKKGPGATGRGLTMTNTLAGKTYVNLKRLKQRVN
jgi:hypothetical protein